MRCMQSSVSQFVSPRHPVQQNCSCPAGKTVAKGSETPKKASRVHLQAQAQRSKRTLVNKAIVALLQAEVRENDQKQTKHGPVIARSKLTKPCAGLFAYLPAKGSFKLAATTKVASVIDAKGGWSHLLALQKVHDSQLAQMTLPLLSSSNFFSESGLVFLINDHGSSQVCL